MATGARREVPVDAVSMHARAMLITREMQRDWIIIQARSIAALHYAFGDEHSLRDALEVEAAVEAATLGGVRRDALRVLVRVRSADKDLAVPLIRLLRRIRLARSLAKRQLPLDVPLKERITVEAARLVEDGYSALAALAAAEAVELGREHGIRFDRLTFNEHRLLWEAVYETGPVWHPSWVTLPLEHATEATQAGIAPFN